MRALVVAPLGASFGASSALRVAMAEAYLRVGLDSPLLGVAGFCR
jgi:hypothetical protein